MPIENKQDFIAWYGPVKKDESKRNKFKELVTSVSPEAAANFNHFLLKDALVPEVQGESKEETRYRLINEWATKLDLMDHSPVPAKEEVRGDITDIADLPETEVVNDIPTPKPKPQEVEMSAERQAEDIASAVENKQEQASDPSDYLGPHAEPKLSSPPANSDVLTQLGDALSAFIASTDSPPEDTSTGADKDAILKLGKIVHEQTQIIEKLEKKVKSLFNAMRDI